MNNVFKDTTIFNLTTNEIRQMFLTIVGDHPLIILSSITFNLNTNVCVIQVFDFCKGGLEFRFSLDNTAQDIAQAFKDYDS